MEMMSVNFLILCSFDFDVVPIIKLLFPHNMIFARILFIMPPSKLVKWTAFFMEKSLPLLAGHTAFLLLFMQMWLHGNNAVPNTAICGMPYSLSAVHYIANAWYPRYSLSWVHRMYIRGVIF